MPLIPIPFIPRYVIVFIAAPIVYILAYMSTFVYVMANDIERNGSRPVRIDNWGTEPNIMRRFLFIGYSNYIPIWHYALMWIYLAASTVSILLAPIYDLFFDTEYAILFRWLEILMFNISAACSVFVVLSRNMVKK